MKKNNWLFLDKNKIFFPALALTVIGLFVLNSISPGLFPTYYLYVLVGLILYFVISRVDFELFGLFAKHFYVLGLVGLFIPLIFGRITHGAIRWIQIGNVSIQPSELVRPFLYLFLAFFLSQASVKRTVISFLFVGLYVLLILIQPSLTVALLTTVGYLGCLLASKINLKFLVFGFLAVAIAVGGFLLLAKPYQKERLTSFLNYEQDPLGSGYNSIQAVISVGSGGFLGKGFGKGTQTQLAFLPEKHNDFIVASIGEEFGILGVLVVLVLFMVVLYQVLEAYHQSADQAYGAYCLAVFVVLTVQVTINVLMNLGMFPVAGVNFPLVSYGGSSYIATMVMLGLVSSDQ